MSNQAKYSDLSTFLASSEFCGKFLENESMSKHTSYKIGGPARFLIDCDDLNSLQKIVKICFENNIEWIIVGSGTNLLVSDSGFDGVMLRLSGVFKCMDIEQDQNCFSVGGACKLAKVVHSAYINGITGFEFGVGTPGTIGGAIRMNAGTSDCGISTVTKSVYVLHDNGQEEVIDAGDIQWGYRTCSLKHGDIVLGAKLHAKKLTQQVDINNMQFLMDEKLKRRKKTQPLNYPTCGSVFKNPDGDSAGRLIEGSGLKGKIIGGARVSKMHANFIENFKDASADDVASLIYDIQTKVKDKYGVELKPEVKFLGFDEKA